MASSLPVVAGYGLARALGARVCRSSPLRRDPAPVYTPVPPMRNGGGGAGSPPRRSWPSRGVASTGWVSSAAGSTATSGWSGAAAASSSACSAARHLGQIAALVARERDQRLGAGDRGCWVGAVEIAVVGPADLGRHGTTAAGVAVDGTGVRAGARGDARVGLLRRGRQQRLTHLAVRLPVRAR